MWEARLIVSGRVGSRRATQGDRLAALENHPVGDSGTERDFTRSRDNGGEQECRESEGRKAGTLPQRVSEASDRCFCTHWVLAVGVRSLPEWLRGRATTCSKRSS